MAAALKDALHAIGKHVAPNTPLAKYIAAVLEPAAAAGTPSRAQVRTAANLEMFLGHQATHAELMARYNPTLAADEEERVRLSARRVGLDVPKAPAE